jgi:RNA polymerase sigma factor (sigma-70 family)
MRRNRGVFSELSLDSAADRVESLEKAVDSGKLNADVLDNVRVMLASLSPRERKIVTLFYMFGYSYAEIASEESISEKTVQSFLAHARAKLRERVSAKKS